MSSWKKSILELHRCVEVSIHFPFQLWISLHVLWAEFLGKKGSLHVRSFTNSTFLVSTIFLSPHNVFGKYILSYFSFLQPQQSNSPPLYFFFLTAAVKIVKCSRLSCRLQYLYEVLWIHHEISHQKESQGEHFWYISMKCHTLGER